MQMARQEGGTTKGKVVQAMLEIYVSLVNRLQDLRETERGQTMAEYGVILAVITLVVLGAITALSGGIGTALGRVTAILTAAR